MLIDTARMK